MPSNQHQTVLISINNELKIHVPNSTAFLSTYVLLEQEDWFEAEMDFVRNYIKPGMNIIDIGANFGVYTLNIAKSLNGQGNIFAFEPTPLTSEYLKLSIEENQFSNITLYHQALSNFDGESTFYTNENSELNSLSVQTKNSQCIKIPTTTLDNISKNFSNVKIDFIKIDAEGEELNIINGASDFLNKQNPLIMFEYKHGNTVNYSLLSEIENKGYVLLKHIPGLNILFPVEDKTQIDDYQLNLFCCSKEMFSDLIKQNLAVNQYSEKVELPENYTSYWKNTLNKIMPTVLIEHMNTSIDMVASENDNKYMNAINYYCLAKDSTYSASDKLGLLQLSFNIMEDVITQPTRLEYILSYSRIAIDLGYRTVALNTLNLLIENFKVYETTQHILPFIPTKDNSYESEVNKPLLEFIYLKTLENVEKLRNFSSYFMSGNDLGTLQRLIDLGSQDCQILRRYQLVRLRMNIIDKFEYIPKLSVKSNNNLNPKIWPANPSMHLKKADAEDFQGRFREIMSDPSNQFIHKVADAGKIIGNDMVLHNGLKVCLGEHSYYGKFSEILSLNNGIHEPQEERVFMEVLKYIPENSTMIELGSYWSFYSMWFQKTVKGARNYMIEPEPKNLESGKRNFSLNSMKGDFTLGSIGSDGVNIDEFVELKNIDTIELLHADIQGFEIQMLHGAQKTILNRKIKFIFVSTHSQELHYQCLDFLKNNGYIIIAFADFDHETYCYDGIIVAKLNGVNGPSPIELEVRSPQEALSINY